jgi:hypothetical protein
VAYHFNWGHDEVLDMPHWERQRWCEEISAINERMNEGAGSPGGPPGPGGPAPGDTGGTPTLEQEIPDEFFEEDTGGDFLEEGEGP